MVIAWHEELSWGMPPQVDESQVLIPAWNLAFYLMTVFFLDA
jgi:hypothetical protein